MFWWKYRIWSDSISIFFRKTSCTVSNSSGFSSVANSLYSTGTYKLSMNGLSVISYGE